MVIYIDLVGEGISYFGTPFLQTQVTPFETLLSL